MNAAAHWLALGQGLGASARALFGAPVLGWADGWQRPLMVDSAAPLDGLIRQVLATTADRAGARPAPARAEPDAQPLPRPPAVPPWPARVSPRPAEAPPIGVAQRRAQRATTASSPGAAARPVAARYADPAVAPSSRVVPTFAPVAPAQAPARPTPRSTGGPSPLPTGDAPAVDRRRVAADAAASVGPVATPATNAPSSPSSARILDWPAMRRVASPALTAAIDAMPRGPMPSGAPREPVWVSPATASRGATASAWPPAADRESPAPAMPAATPRLVDSLPALQGLMQRVVDQSRGEVRDAGAPRAAETPVSAMAVPVDAAPARVMPMPPAVVDAQVPVATPPRFAAVWPELDAQAEEILVDRLADRLNERLRDDALRHLGFTGGLV